MTWNTGLWTVDFGRWALLAVMLSGCGYSHQQLFPKDVRTVAVPVFETRSFYQGVEFDLTEATIKEIELRSPYKVVPQDRADTILTATITKVDQQRLSRRRSGGLVQELELRIRVDFKWKDLRSNRTLRQRRGFEAVGRYIPATPIAEPFEIAQHQAVQQLAQQMVSVMAEDW